MKKQITLTLAFIAFLLSNNALSQISITVSTDAIPLFYKGYAFEGALNYKKTRFSLNLNEFEVPEFINPNYDSINKLRQSLDLTVSRFIKDDHSGLHYGVSFGFVYNETLTISDSLRSGTLTQTDIDNLPRFDHSYFKIGLNLGYFIFPFKNKEKFKGFYIEPMLTVNYNVYKDQILNQSVSDILSSPVSFDLPSIHLGYKFTFGS